MDSRVMNLIAADAILVGHMLFVAFVISGLFLIITGKVLSWSWVRNPWFRLVHLLAIGIVTLEAWAGVFCPLTRWEMAFRSKAGDVSQLDVRHRPKSIHRQCASHKKG